MKFRVFVLFLFAPLIVWALFPQTTVAAVDLIYFIGHGYAGFVRLEWETATELDNVGFYIVRSNTETGSYARVSEFIPTGPDSISGYQYGFVDSNVVDGTGYWYKLESIDTGNLSSFEGPIQVIAGVFATEIPTATATRTGQAGLAATSTKTATPTRTRTPTATSITSFSQHTATVSGFSTPFSGGQPTNPSASMQSTLQNDPSGLSLTGTLTATATLIPVPEITMQFPTALVESGLSKNPPDSGEQSSGLEGTRRVWFTLERLIFLGFILLVWVLLAGWFYLSYSQIEK